MVAGHEDEQYLTIFAGKTGEENGKLGDMGMKMHNIPNFCSYNPIYISPNLSRHDAYLIPLLTRLEMSNLLACSNFQFLPRGQIDAKLLIPYPHNHFPNCV